MNLTLTPLTTIITDAVILLLTVMPSIILIRNGMKCLLRSDMLRIYYHNKGSKTIRQYEYENFLFLYKAYKTLKGNSFIDKIYKEVQSWEVIT